MSLTQLHPEDLFDKEARGALTTDERARLELHVAQCAPCKLERLLRADFEAENEAPLSYSDLVAGALGAVGAQHAAQRAPHAGAPEVPELGEAPEAPAPSEAKPTRRSSTAWRRVALLMAAAFALVCTAAVASPQGRSFVRRAGTLLSSGEDIRDREATPRDPVKVATSPLNPTVHGAAARAVTPALPEAPSAPETPANALVAPVAPVAPVAAPLAPATPATPATPAGRAAPAGQTAGAHHPSATLAASLASAGPTRTVAAPAPAPEPVADAAALFALANTRRSAGDVAGSLAAYRELTSRYPASREAATAHALSGRVLLASRDAGGALAEFDAYLRTGRGELREEAMVGRGRALGLQNLHEAEANAWRALLAAYPSSASAEHARLRVQGLSGAR